jgi:hypothetical protein
MASKIPSEFVIHVRFEPRHDGGLRALCDEVPGFLLSHSDPKMVERDVAPALEVLLSEIYGLPMQVRRLPGIDEALNHQPLLAPHITARADYLGLVHA